MQQEHHLAFGPFLLDMTQGCLWRGGHSKALRPRTLAMLCYLAEHSDRLVTKTELRQREVDLLEEWFQRAAQGARQLVFVSGEAGVGKTTVVDLWLARLPPGRALRIGRGQCVEHFGEGEPYLPLLEALGQLGELALQLTLGELLMAAQGMASPDAGEAYARAYTLCQQVGETPQLFRVLSGLFLFHNAQARLRTGREIGQQLFDLAQRQQYPALVRDSYLLRGGVALYLGDFIVARADLERSLELSVAQQLFSSISASGLDPRITGLVWLIRALWVLGYADLAQQRSHEALALAQRVGHTPSLAYAEYFTIMLYQNRRDVASTRAHAEALMGLALEQGFGLRGEQGRILRGWALAMQGDAGEGIMQISQGLAAHQHVGGPELGRPSVLALLAEAYGQAGQPEAGLQAMDEALTRAGATDERWWEAELHRLKGALLLQLPIPDVHQAEACFQHALNVARDQQAKALELRAAMSLCQLQQRQGKRGVACALLAPIYDWFTEGFDTPDLQKARALLTDLS